MTKFIVVSGGVISGIGKGVIASSTGLLLKTLGLRVTAIKIDPYMNIDAGTMAPTEHGEVFVLDDGGEADLDLGNYERYLDVTLSKDNNITTGKIYREVIEKERRGDYLGKTVQIVPHLTNAIQDWLLRVAAQPVDSTGLAPEVCIVELGGTVGDIESAPFVEALRQFQFRVGQDNFALVHVSLVPVIGGEQKTKPTQAAIKDLRGLGLVPDMIACRSPAKLDQAVINKLSMFCHVAPDQVLGVHDVESTYHVPLLLEQQGMVKFLEKRLGLELKGMEAAKKEVGRDLRRRWRDLTATHDRMIDTVEIVLVGKYTSLQDSYMSVIKSLEHSAMRCHRKLKLKWVEASDLEPQTASDNPVRYHEAWHSLCSAKGILVPGGFGVRGTEGMISAAKWAREKRVPYLGICLGFQIAVIEFARNVCGLTGANSAEMDPDCRNPVVVYMPEVSKTQLGGTMRLGLRPSVFSSNSKSWSKIRTLYGAGEACWERHRHRYEINPEMVSRLEAGSSRSNGSEQASSSIGGRAEVTSPGLGYPGAPDTGLPVRGFRRTSSSASAFSTLAPSDTSLNSDDSLEPATSLRFVGKSTSGARMQILELQDHPYFVGMQAHPEFASRPLNPSPPFLGLVAAASGLDVLDEQLANGPEYKPPHPTSMMVLGQVQGEANAAEDAAMAKLKPKSSSQPRSVSGRGGAAAAAASGGLNILMEEDVNGASTPVGARSPAQGAGADLDPEALPPGTGSQVINGASSH
ncbi:CTP synthase [Microstroma glucosiphilum]|uniref:CTP synthase n=1 Tax=Pseudomicrostroma glucosiphilum TaxID=1684307 RepID=A0A316U4R3_9BASI|nr:CTP synthase [Pseudomicrostroma glucosiphilum]PWN19461.1 CTP synthase [Pseudomicrostroma glucosiphilum]